MRHSKTNIRSALRRIFHQSAIVKLIFQKSTLFSKWHQHPYHKPVHLTVATVSCLGIVGFGFLFINAALALSSWGQTDWSGGTASGTVSGNVTTYESSTNLTTGTADQITLAHTSDWYDTGWKYRVKITIDKDEVAADATNFPVYLDLSELPASFFSGVRADGGDIRITSDDGTSELSRQITTINTASKTGSVFFLAPSLLSTTNTSFYIYYGNSGATNYADSDTHGANSVWTDYEIVSHLGDNPTGTITDSTGKGNTATTGGSMTSGDVVSSPVGKGLNIDSNDYVNYGNKGNIGTGDLSFSIWFRSSDSDGGSIVAKSYYSGADGRYGILLRPGAGNGVTLLDAGPNYNPTYDGSYFDNQWHQATITYDRDGNSTTYIDGSQVGSIDISPASSFDFNTTNSLILGKYNDVSGVPYKDVSNINYEGDLSEFRETRRVLDSDWVATEYNNQSSPDDFYSVGSQEARYVSSGTLTSNIFDAGTFMDWGNLTYNTSGSGTTNVKVRSDTSNTMSSASAWASCNAISSGTDLSSSGCVNDGDQYIQYQITLLPDDATTPVFEDIGMAFSPSDIVPPTTNASNLQMNKSPGGNSVNSNAWTNAQTPYFSWTAGTDNAGGTGIKGYCLYLGQDNTASLATTAGVLGTSPLNTNGACQFAVSTDSVDLSVAGYIGTNMTSSNAPYYLLVKAIDYGNNLYAGSPAIFQFRYDNTEPNNPAFVTAPSQFISSKDITLTWDTSGGSSPSDTNSGLAGLQYRIGSSGTWYGDVHNGDQNNTDLLTNDGSYQTVNPTDYDKLQEGNNIIYFRTWDNAGNVTTANVTTVVKINTSSPSSPQNVSATPPINSTNSFSFSWLAPASYTGSVANITYCYTINTLPTDGSCSYTDEGQTSLPVDAYATQPGENTIYVVAKDEAGNVNYATAASATFTANTPAPGVPLNPEIADVSTKSTSSWKLALSWNEPGNIGAGIAKYKVYRSTDGTNYSLSTSTSGKSLVDTDLSQITYYYKIMACDSANNCGAFSSSVSATPTGRFTSPASLIAPPDVGNISTRKATVSWFTDRDSDSKVAFSTTSGVYSNEEVSSSNQTTSHTINLRNLSPGTTYYFRVKWTDVDGNTGVSAEKTFTTAPAPTISDVTAKKVGLSSAIIDFTSKDAVKVNIYYGKNEGFGGLQTVNTSLTKSTYVVDLQGLDDGTTYFYKLNPVDSDGNEYEGTVLNFTTPPRPRISNLRFQPVKGEPTSTQKVTWTTNVAATSEINYGRVGGGSVTSLVPKLDTNHVMIIRHLEDDSQYELIAQSRDKGGNLAISDTQTFHTELDTRPPSISNISIEPTIRGVGAAARGQIVVSWHTDEPSTSQVAYAIGSHTTTFTNRSAEDTGLGTEHVVIVSDLPTSKVFSVQPVSRDRAGNAGEGEVKTAIVGRASDSVLTIVLDTLKGIFGF